MKKNTHIIFLICSFLFFFTNCNEDLDITRTDRANNAGNSAQELVLDKKGIGMSYKELTWSTRIGRLKTFWHYSWNRDLKDNIPDSVEYVPMFWGTNSVNDSEIARIKGFINEGKVKHVLGFNEPDLETQANMSVDEAIALWPKLEELGVPLGSPVPAETRGPWLEEFIQKANENNLRVDFIALHIYQSNNPQLFLDIVDKVYEKYNLPIWITEMSVVDNEAETADENRYTSSQILATMRKLLPELYNRKYVERFAWFSATKDSPNYPRQAASILFDDQDNLTELGQFYANYKSNSLSGKGLDKEVEVVEEVDGNLLQNGTFETGKIEPWAGFKNAVISSSVQEANTGSYLGRIEPHDGSIYQIIDVEAGKTYTYTFFHRFKKIPPNTFNAVIRNEEGDEKKFFTYEIPKTDIWKENKLEFTVPDDVTKARLVFYKPQLDPLLPSFFLDDVVVLIKQ
tara:strand:+ start:845 stop:2215 length:1371 start_codon:yes stop_codon:yes gene_type:complete